MTKQTATAALLWTAVLGASAIFGSWFFACVFPFAAMATIAAMTLDLRRGAALVVATWSANQIVGFTLMNYPQDVPTVALGISLGIGALLGFVAARTVLARLTQPVAAVAALAAAFVTYEAAIYVGALGFGGTDTFSPAIIGGVALNDAIWFAALLGLRALLTRTLPAQFGTQIAARA
ncbi:hypothetical protein [Sphingomonas sp. SUN039]|uniref:hypothetical protein n=1 Tax=Sphingomonas sp. SUN039 TaxID=2937787 RepID=UPI00216409B3|nr:hypothetical protein [Sphingomonas sp. SUN039]UVO52990.1 hypothetical protein M0209_02210 [Sphingomonas sp. SUN039]